MGKRTEFHTVEFFRKVRDDQAAALKGKSPQEIIAFFESAVRKAPRLTRRSTRTRARAARAG